MKSEYIGISLHNMLRYVVGLFVFGIIHCECINITRQNIRRFPDGFLFGTATSAYQIEGAWNEDGKSESIWDHLVHTNPSAVLDHSNGDIAVDSYHNYKRDVQMLRELGVDYYRFSLSWPRILPTSFPDQINEKGVEYYNNLIDELLKYNIVPMMTLYHWDLPQTLQDMGGWTNPHIVDWFADFARVAYSLFGDRVKYFNTINEPYSICNYGYGDVNLAPMVDVKGISDYMCIKNLLMAHATAYHIYDTEFRPKFGGVAFIAFNAQWYEPETEADIDAAEEANQFTWGIYTHPIYSESGDYPPIVKERVAAKSAAQGFLRSRLIELTPAEIEYIKGSSDLFGLNHYSSYITYRNSSVIGYHDVPSFMDDGEFIRYELEEWLIGEADFVHSNPPGFYKLLTKIRNDYNNPPVFITENGFSTLTSLIDDDRIMYISTYLDAMLDAMDEGSNVVAYTVWSLMDNFEWLLGYGVRFGLYELDQNSPEIKLTPRKSAYFYKDLLRRRALDMDYEIDMSVPMTIEPRY